MPAELLFCCAYARTYARFFSPFVLGICSFSSVMIDVCLISYNVLQVCHCFSVTLNKKDMYTDLQTTIIGLMGTRLLSVTLCVINKLPLGRLLHHVISLSVATQLLTIKTTMGQSAKNILHYV